MGNIIKLSLPHNCYWGCNYGFGWNTSLKLILRYPKLETFRAPNFIFLLETLSLKKIIIWTGVLGYRWNIKFTGIRKKVQEEKRSSKGKSQDFYKKSIWTKVFSPSLASPLTFNILVYVILTEKKTRKLSTRTFFLDPNHEIQGPNPTQFDILGP